MTLSDLKELLPFRDKLALNSGLRGVAVGTDPTVQNPLSVYQS